ncbi:MAG: gliding motility-associated-like protein [Saprospiraceae bacterium]|jgi:gliding motility-associated-like protein
MIERFTLLSALNPITYFQKHVSFLFLLFCLLPGFAFAQPANDDCGNATTIADVSGGCSIFSFTGATTDLLNGDCTTNTQNTWYQFTAVGSEATIISEAQGGAPMEITLIEFNPDPCDFASAVQFGCSLSPLNVSGLAPGANYYVVITDPSGGGVNNYNICITSNSPNPPPPNDDPCSAVPVVANGSCTNGTTLDATPDWTVGDPACAGLEQNSVWYSTTLGPDMDQLEIDVQGAGGNVMAIVGTFAPDCNGTFNINGYNCGSGGPFTVNNLTENTQYWVLVSTATVSEGPFSVCMTETGLPPGCSDNDFCGNATPYPTPVTGSPCTPIMGCNIGANPEPGLAGSCNFATEEVVWFSFTSDATAGLLSASVVAQDPIAMSQPSIQVFLDCAGTPISDCSSGTNGQVTLVNESITGNTTYFVAVSNAIGDGGYFDLCLQTFADISACVTESALTVQPGSPSFGSPDNGPYQPGETVTMCFEISTYQVDPQGSGNNCQWLQGIVPVFGNCWDETLFDPTASVPNSVYGATWDWWETITYNEDNPNISVGDFDGDGDIELCHITEPTCSNTGITANTVLPPGWFASQNNGNPNSTFGDGAGCNTTNGPWSFCFDLTTKLYPECDQNVSFVDCSVKVYTFADGETGSWNGGPSVCAQDVPEVNFASLNCCEGPTVNYQEAEVCAGGPVFFTLTSNQMNVEYTWTVSPADNPPNPNQYGAFSGSGNTINQTLTNDTGAPINVIYSVSGTNTSEGCVGMPTDFLVTVYPSLEVNIPDVLPVCAGECTDIEAFISGGSGTYVGFEWDQGIPAGSQNANVCPTITTTYSVTVTDLLGCTGEASVTVAANSGLIINIDALPGLESCIDLNDPATVTATVTQGGSGNYGYQWASDTYGLGGSSETEVIFDTETYNVTITDFVTGCTGIQSVDMIINPLPVIVIIDPPAVCESDLQYCFDVFVDNESSGGVGSWGGVADINGCIDPSALGGGTFQVSYEWTDFNGCYDITIYDFIVDPLPDTPAALSDITLCSGSAPQMYTVPLVPGAFTYTWTVPTGATITAGQNTNTITVDWTGSQNGQVCVTADNDCGSSQPSCFNVTIESPPVAPIAPADVSFCDNVPMQSFSIAAVAGATSYTWTVPTGVSITGGQTTTDIMVNWGTAASGQVCVTASNACGTSPQVCANVTILTAPVAPTPPADVAICAGVTGQIYTIVAVPTATGYNWTVPAGATITAGQNTVSITVDWAANATSGQICVTADNTCGASTPGCFDVTVGTIPAMPTPPANSTVCFGETGVAYNVAAVAFTDNYTWTIPTGATIASGNNTNTITVDWGTATSGQICVTANNTCGSSPQACFDITVDEIPVAPETLADVIVCANTTGDMFTVATVMGATSYTWTVPAGSSIAGGQTTNEIEVDWGTTSGQVCVSANNNCGSSPQACFNVTVDEAPVEPTPPVDVIICAGLTGDTYTVPTVTGAITYTWTVPTGATIASGQTTNTIDIDWGTATSGEVCITADNNCGSSAPACFDVMIGDVPPMPTPPANSNVCAGTANSNYAIAPVANTTGYIWTIPTGATITNGDNTTSINVDWGTATTGDICVTATNSCGDSPQACFTVTVDEVPPAPTAPMDATICAGDQGETYTVADVAGATSYTWTMPAGASIVNGLGTTEIEVDWAANATSGQICVTADNDCGMSPQACFNITINDVPLAAIVPADATICENLQGDVYTIADVANANGYAWTVPAGATIANGQNSTSIQIDWGTTGGDVCVTPSNDCGDGPETCFAIMVNTTPQAPIAPQDPTVCQGTTGDVYSVNPVAGATSYTWTIPADATITNGIDTDEITIDWGTATSGQICVTANNDCGPSAQACFDVTIDEIPAAPIAPADDAVCAGVLSVDYSILPVAGANNYTWSTVGGATITGGQNTTNITVDYDNSADATICVTANNNCGSSAEVCFSTTINPIPTADFTVVSPICNDVTSTITYTGSASANATYIWNFNGGTNTTAATGAGPYEIEWNAGGTYTVSLTVSENTCESAPVTIDVEVETPLAAPVINCNTTTSSIEFTWAAIPGATGYLVDNVPNVGTTYEVTGLAAGTAVTIVVTALGNGPCGDSEATQTCIAEDCPIVDLVIDAVAPICLDANTGIINLNVVVTGSAGTGSGLWSGTGISDPVIGTFDPNAANIGNNPITYTYTEGPCMYSQSIDVVVNSQPTADFTVPSPICAADTVTVNYTGTATATATYNWDFGNADYADGTGAGPYEVHFPAGADQTVTLTVTSLAGCPSEQMSQTVVIDAPLAEPNIICNSSTDNIEFTWDAITGATGYLVNNIPQPGTSYTASGLDAGDMITITVIAVGNGSCGNSQATQTCTADDCPPVQIDIDPVADICLDASAMPINLNAVVSGPGTGQWSGPGIEDATTGLFNPNAVSVSAGPNIITYNYVDGNCTGSETITIVVIPQPTASFTVDPTVCEGGNISVAFNGTFNAVATYIWNFGNGTVVTDLGQEVYEVQMPVAGIETITLQVIENNCTSELAILNVQVDAPLAVPVITCETTTTSITFSWDAIPGANGYTVNNVPQGGTSFTVSGLNTGDMETITVVALGTGACGNSEATQSCTAEECPNNIDVTIDPVMELCIGDGPINLNVVVTGGNGGSGLWSGIGITDQVMGTFNPNAVGVLIGPNQITYTYSEPPCNYSTTIDIIVNEIPSAVFTMDAEACIGGEVNVIYQGVFSGTATYNWDFGNGVIVTDLGQENYTIQFPTAGSQDVSLEVINNGCNSGTQTENIQVDAPLPLPNIICNPTLNSVEFTWDAIPGVTDYIVNGVSQTELSFEFTGLAEGDQVMVTLIAVGNGPCGNSETSETCEASACPTVNLVIDPVGDVCETATPTGMIDLEVTITGSNGTGIGSWTGTGIVNATTGMFNPDDAALVNGANTVTYSFDEDGCNFSESIVINVFDLPAANAGPTAELSCSNGNVTTLMGSGSGTPMWTGGTYDSGQDSYNPVITSPGIYTLTVTDASGCTNTATVEITADPSVPVATSLGDLILDCNNNITVTLQADGTLGADYQVTWTGPSINAANMNDESITLGQASDAGDYSFIITNTNLNCDSEPAFISVGLDTLPPNAIIQFAGSLDCTGGVELSTVIEPNTTVTWEDPEGTITTSNQLEALTAGTYILYVVNDINGCDNFSTIDITDNTAYPIANAGDDQVLDCTNLDGVTLDGSDSQMGATITLTWSTLDGVIDGPTDQSTATATAPGTYTLTTLDTDNGCTENDIVVVTEDTNTPVAEAGDLAEFGCADEVVSLSGTGTTGADTYEWTDANGTVLSNSVNIDVTEPGTYFLEVLNSGNECNDSDSVVVNPATNFPFAIDPLISPPSCFGDTDGFINITGVSGGTAPYMYSIDGGAFGSFPLFSFLEGNMTYEITIEDADGCTFETELSLSEPAPLEIIFNTGLELDYYATNLGDESINLNPTYSIPNGAIDTLLWSPIEFLECPDSVICFNPQTDSTLFYSTTFSVTLIDTFGCSITRDILVDVNKDRPVYIPNAFSPNGDGFNDIFKMYPGDFDRSIEKVNYFRIFNRWGEIVHEAEFFNLDDSEAEWAWDGTFKGKGLNPGVFVYITEIEFVDGFKTLYKGDVTIKK